MSLTDKELEILSLFTLVCLCLYIMHVIFSLDVAYCMEGESGIYYQLQISLMHIRE